MPLMAAFVAGRWSAKEAEAKQRGEPLRTDSIADAVEDVGRSVVSVKDASGRASGSGFVLESSVVVTNSHVVAGGRRKGLEVALSDGRSYPAEVIGADGNTDIAALKVKGAPELPKAKIGSSSEMRVGDWVACIGSPLDLSQSATVGIVSAQERTGEELGIIGAGPFLQTDAAVNSGNSGVLPSRSYCSYCSLDTCHSPPPRAQGPLVNVKGEVVAVATMRAMGAEGVSFALPADHAVRAARELVQRGQVSKPYLGVGVIELSHELIEHLHERDKSFPKGITHGLFVPHVHPSSPASRAGIQPNDVIVSAEGVEITNATRLIEAIRPRIGAEATLEVVRGGGGQRVSVKVRVGQG